MTDQLILTLNQHPVWGYVLQTVIAQPGAANGLSILETASTANPLMKEYNEAAREIVRITERISDKSLMQAYSKEKTVQAFLLSVSAETTDRYIRPCIESYHQKILELLAESKLCMYLRKSNKERTLYETEQIETNNSTAQVLFYFSREPEKGLHYYVRVKHQGKELSLLSQTHALLCSEPAAMVVGSKLLVFKDIDNKKLLPFFNKSQIQVPASSEKEYIRKFVRSCVEKYEVQAKGFSIDEIFPQRKAVLSLESDWNKLPVLCLHFYYNDKKYPSDRPKGKIVDVIEKGDEISLQWFAPDKAWEAEQISLLTSNGLMASGLDTYSLPAKAEELYNDMPLLIDWLREHKDLLEHFDFSQQIPSQHYYMGEIEMQNRIETGNDWFDLSSEAVFGEFRIPFASFRQNILSGTREYVLPDGSIAILPLEWFAKYAELMLFGKKKGNLIRLPKTHFKLLAAMDDSEEPAACAFKQELLPAPTALQATLRSYQQLGYSWMVYLYQQGFGGCLADDMGLGKTIQTISLLLHLQDLQKENKLPPIKLETNIINDIPAEGQLSIFDQPISTETAEAPENTNIPSLIVLPTSLVHNWVNELKRFAPSLMYYIHTGNKRLKNQHSVFKMFDVVITTYGTLRKDIKFLEKCQFHHLILDEGQNIKNPSSDTHKAVKQIHAQHKLVLTGTPIENSLTDLWAILDLLNPGMLGSLTAFKDKYVNIETVDAEATEKLLSLIQPFILRRTKQDAAPELPALQEEIVYCEMSAEQLQQYEEEKNKLRNRIIDLQISNAKQTAFVALQGLTRLRLMANHPVLTDAEYAGESGKFAEVIRRIRTLREEGHKVLVFSSFVKHLRLLADYFEQESWDYAWLTGACLPEERERQIQKFMRQPEAGCFFVSLKAGGVGLNLTVADYVFILDPWWNPAAEMQALSRTHRIGQQNKVIAYRFITTDSIEEKIRHLQESKTLLADTFINNKNPLSRMQANEITDLIN